MSNNIKTILLVEDEAIIAMSESIQLQNFGYQVILANSGNQAVDLFKNNKNKINLILMDINLGNGIDGTEAAKQILSTKNVPIVFLTSHSEEEYVNKVKEITRYGYIIKNSGDFVLKSSIEMAFELFETNEKLSKNEQRLSFALDGANDGLWDVVMDTGGVYLSKRGCEILGYTELELPEIVKVWSELVHPEDLVATQAALDAYLEGKEEIFIIEQRLRMKSGEYKWVLSRGKAVSYNTEGKPVRMVGTHTDISERKKVEEVLNEKNVLFQALLDNSPVYIFFKDHNIKPIYLSKNYEKLLGLPLEQILGKDMNELFPSNLAKSMIEDDKKILNDGRLIQIDEELNGKYYTTIKFPIKIKDSPPLLAGFTLDITERKIIENKNKLLLSEKEILLKEVNHRIKNNLTTIESLLKIKLNSIHDHEAKLIIQETVVQLHSMSLFYDKFFLTDNFIETSIQVFLSNLVDDILRIFPGKVPVKIEKKIEDFIMDGKTLFSLGIIINELITNAIKYAFINKNEGLIEISVLKKGNKVTIIVRDDGIGVSDKIDVNNSHGFGLSLINMLVLQLNGNIIIENDNGTKVVLEFSF